MREILFRGKSVNNGEWVEGFLVIDTIFCEDAVPVKHYHIDEINLGTFPVEFQSGISETVDPETVGQFTGLTDKNGKKIFEGDIVESEFTKKPYLVCFGEYTYANEYGEESSACGWYNEEKGGYVTGFGCPDAWATVIGNIHDNPELVEVK